MSVGVWCLLAFEFSCCVMFSVACLLFTLLVVACCLVSLCAVCCLLIVANMCCCFVLLHADVVVAWCCNVL